MCGDETAFHEGALLVKKLPEPVREGGMPLHTALSQRRSVRQFEEGALLSDTQLGQLLWAAQGMTRENVSDVQGRTASSAGALYPVRVYAASPEGLFRYNSAQHALEVISDEDVRFRLASAALGQSWVREASLVLVMTVLPNRLVKHYGVRAQRYMAMEVGHIAQNVQLQSVSLGLGSVITGSFHDQHVHAIVALSKEEEPVCLIPVGVPVYG